jgi:transposase
VLAATGGYERLAFGLLWAEGLPAAPANPRAVRRFAEAMGLLGKTDRIDAAAIARYAAAQGIVAVPPAREAPRKLAALVTRLRQLTSLRTMQLSQRRLLDDADAHASIEELLALRARQIRELEGKIAQRIAQDPTWAALAAAFRGVKGVAGRTVARLWPSCRKSARCRARPPPSSPAWRRSPATVAKVRASGRCAAVAAASARSCSW